MIWRVGRGIPKRSRILMIPKQWGIKSNCFVSHEEIFVCHVQTYTGKYTGKSQHLSNFSLFFLSCCTPLVCICVTILDPPGTLKQPQAENVSDTG